MDALVKTDVAPTGFRPVAETLPQVIERLVRALNPQKIILFGSYAYGQPTPDSDVDLLVVLLFRAAAFPKTHDLPTLHTLCEQNGILTGFSPDDLTFLTDCAAVFRTVRGNYLTVCLRDLQEIRDAKSMLQSGGNSIRRRLCRPPAIQAV